MANPPQASRMPPDWRKKILHATLTVGNYLLQGADVPAKTYQKPQGFSVMLNIEDVSEAERIFHISTACLIAARYKCHCRRRSGRSVLA